VSSAKYAPLVWKNLGRNRLRTVITGVAIAFAVMMVCVLRTLPAALDGLLDSMSTGTRISVHNEAGLTYSLPYAYVNKIRAMPGVVDAASYQWFGGVVDEDAGVQFPNFAVDADHVGRVFEDWKLDPKALEDFVKYRDGAMVGDMVMEAQGWKVGDLITLESTVFPVEARLRIVGVIEDRPFVWFSREYLEQAMLAQGASFDVTGVVWVRIDDASQLNALMARIDDTFRNSEAETASETEKSFFQNMMSNAQGYVTILLIVAGVVTLCIVFIAANTASMSVRERVGELAVMKAVGFRWRTLFGMLVVEAALLSTLAGAAGVVMSIAAVDAMRAATSGGGAGPMNAFFVSNAVLVQTLFLSCFVGILSGALPSFGAARRAVAQTLREVF
jgi:putative ABC transport system permease protein